ncbi:MAG: DNA ligase D [Actinobacteria bacterium]|nr:DNA ligase D [Actinomycetota bacterium]
MSLKEYREKRRFKLTPEPIGGEEREEGPLRFVVQKHKASHLHYDFRLELGGVLKSWAVPKGPSLNPKDKHLAIMVEDHPIEYRTFEGVIPEGNYGAGAVMVWDEGRYRALKIADRPESEDAIAQELSKGHISFILEGKKLKGGFALVKLRRGGENAWLLVKKSDEFATGEDVTKRDRSALSNRTMDEIAESALKPEGYSVAVKGGELDLGGVPKSPMPRNVRPMLATLVEDIFDRRGWVFELKWDGFRAIAEVERGQVYLYSRNLQPFNERFPDVVDSLKELGDEAVLDGEIVVLDEKGKPRFQLLQNYHRTRRGRLIYYIFDLLYLDGHDLRGLPLRRRKDLLRQILPDRPHIKLSDHIEEKGIAFFKEVSQQNLEGVLAKDGGSPYREGVRGREWLKVKTLLRQEAVIGGFTEPRGSRKHLGALVLGVYEGGELIYVGHAGGGFDDKGLAEMRSTLDPLVQETSPFKKRPKTNAPVHWVRPTLVCEVKFREWTKDDIMRQPIFLGLREDKGAEEVRRERPSPGGAVFGPEPPGREKRGDEDIRIDGRLKLTNLNKVFWPKERYTKRDLVNYYREIAPFILPYLRDRPEVLNRHPDGIEGEHFFQKDVAGLPPPDWTETVNIRSETEDKEITYLLCQNEATLVYLANLGCIEINPWSSRLESLDSPDFLLLDLDPLDIEFEHVVEAALAVGEVLEEAGAVSCCKTSGATGLHIYVPLGAKYTYEQARRFAEIVAFLAHRKLPERTSLERLPARRRRKVYLDYLQNIYGKTLAAPYSVRPMPGATVSTPLKWDEVKPGLDPAAFTIRTTIDRFRVEGDIFSTVLGPGVDLGRCLGRLERAA